MPFFEFCSLNKALYSFARPVCKDRKFYFYTTVIEVTTSYHVISAILHDVKLMLAKNR